jgi:hypothetical protein
MADKNMQQHANNTIQSSHFDRAGSKLAWGLGGPNWNLGEQKRFSFVTSLLQLLKIVNLFMFKQVRLYLAFFGVV